MTNFFSQIHIISKMSSYGKRSLLKIFIAGALLFVFIHLFLWANQIPQNKVNVSILAEGPEYVDMDMTLAVSNRSLKGYLRDSSMNKLVERSGDWGRFWGITAGSPTYSSSTHTANIGAYTTREYIKAHHPQQLNNIDSVNSCIWTYFCFESTSRLPRLTRNMQERFVNKHFQDTNFYVNDSLAVYIHETRNHYQYNCFKGHEHVYFKDTLSKDVIVFYSDSHSSVFNINNPVFGNVNRELKDISRSYTYIHLLCQRRIYQKDSLQTKNLWWEELPGNFRLTIDFGSPISLADVIPEPDEIGLTKVVYSDPEKLKHLMKGEVDLLLFVKHLENENKQSMRLFWLTTIITALATWIVTVSWKWIEYASRRKRFKKRLESQGA